MRTAGTAKLRSRNRRGYNTHMFESEKVLRVLTNFWTVAFLGFIVLNFFREDHYEFLITPFSILYVGLLTLYAGTKEFERWYDFYDARHPGEIFVVLWTVVVLALFAVSIVADREYHMSFEVVADYIAVLSIFAITRKSKGMHREKMERARRRSGQKKRVRVE